MTAPTQLATRLLGTVPATGVSAWWTRNRLRVLAYHDVPVPGRFARQLEHLVRHYHVVDADRVAAAVHGVAELPARAVWITFDDGHPDVLHHGSPLLERFQVPATMFVCPAAIESGTSLWWQQVEAAVRLARPPGSSGDRDAAQLVASLKGMPDAQRRRAVRDLAAWAAAHGHDVTRARPQLTVDELRAWQRAGHTVGNHTWDHPCLDRCSAEAQRQQIERADRWLRTHLPGPVRFFAYPNGNHAPTAERALVDNGYALATLFDHRLVRDACHPLRMSRLRVAADAPLPRFRSIVSGNHATGAAAMQRLRRQPVREVVS